MTLDELRENAEAAKAWRPDRRRFCPKSSSVYMDGWGCGCDACLGAKRAVEDIADRIRAALDELVAVFVDSPHPMKWDHTGILAHADVAARIASYFASEPHPVSEFRDAVKEACK